MYSLIWQSQCQTWVGFKFCNWKPNSCRSLAMTCHCNSISCKRMFCKDVLLIDWKLKRAFFFFFPEMMEPSQCFLPRWAHWWEDKQEGQVGIENTCQPPLGWEWGLPTKINEYSGSSHQFHRPAMTHPRHSLRFMFLHPSRWPGSLVSTGISVFLDVQSVCERKEKRKTP